MNKITRSLAIPFLFPKSTESWEGLEKTVRFLEAYRRGGAGFTQLEFFHPPGRDKDIARLLGSAQFASIFNAIPVLKGANFSLCSLDEEERGKAVALLKSCMDRAVEIGSHSVMLNSGFIPAYAPAAKRATPSQAQLGSSCGAYVRSIEEAAEYGDKQNYAVNLLLEPGDSKVQSFQLLGPTERVVETIKRIKTPRYALTMDVAHIREEGEDVMAALKQTLPWCSHVHLCNCVMDDPANPLYGDKHVDFDCPGACWNYDGFGTMFRDIKNLFGEKDFTVALEIACRAEDNQAWFDSVVSKCPWLF